MTWRDSVNAVLSQRLGYQLQRVASTADYPADWDAEAKAIVSAVRPYTMTTPERVNALVLATRYVLRHDIPGAFVECGVWRGGSMQAVARTLLAAGDVSRELYLFDTFEGMTEPTEADRRVSDGASAGALLAEDQSPSGVLAKASLADVQNGFAALSYPPERVHYVVGPVEETVPDAAPEQIAVLRLDTDWYASTKHELEHLYDRISPRGVLIIDDYGWWEGCRRAVDEFLEATSASLLLVPVDGGRIAIVP